MMRSQGQGEQKESGGAEESATVKERPEGASPASRAGNSREFDVRRNWGEHVGDRVRAQPEEVGPEMKLGSSGQNMVSTPWANPLQARQAGICVTFWARSTL